MEKSEEEELHKLWEKYGVFPLVLEENEIKEIELPDEVSEIENIGELIDFNKNVFEEFIKNHSIGKWWILRWTVWKYSLYWDIRWN